MAPPLTGGEALNTRTGRARLAPSKAPYWHRIRPGLRLGYRRTRTAGTWLVRVETKRGPVERSLGPADDVVGVAAPDLLDFRAALSAAVTLAAKIERDAQSETEVATVADAIRAYAAAKSAAQQHTAANEALALARHYIPPELAEVRLTDLTPDRLRKWKAWVATQAPRKRTRKGHVAAEGRTLSPERAKGLATVLKAALRMADDASRDVIAKGLAAGKAREVVARQQILDAAEIARLLAAADEVDPDLGLLLAVGHATGARFGQLAAMVVADFDPAERLLFVPRSAKGGAGKRRDAIPYPVPASLAARLETAVAGRSRHEPLLMRAARERVPGVVPAVWRVTGRRAWGKGDYRKQFAEAVARARLPATTVFYALRHSRIVSLLLKSVPVRVVAVMADTSVPMIEKNYSRHLARHQPAVDMVRRALELGA